MTRKMLLAAIALAVLPGTAFAGYPYPGSDHDTLGECYDYVVNQYNDNGDEEGLDWAMDNCDEIYEAVVVGEAPIGNLGTDQQSSVGGRLIILPPASLSETGDGAPAFQRRR